MIEEAVDDAIGGMRGIPVALVTHGRLKMTKSEVMRSLGKLLCLLGWRFTASIDQDNA